MSTQFDAAERVTLPQELSEFLIELSIALHRHAMYPAGHPALQQAAADVVEHVVRLLDERATLSIGVARRQLVIEGVATDPKNPVLRALAERLHEHHIGAVVFQRGVQAEEILDVLALLSQDGDRTASPLGLGDIERLRSWSGIRLYPMTYEQLELVDDEEDEDAPEDEVGTEFGLAGGTRAGTRGSGKGTRSAQLWIGLARAALACEERGAEPESTDPAYVAQAINEHPQAQGYDQVIVGYLLQIAEQLRTERSGAGSAGLRRRMSRLVTSLGGDTLERLVQMGGDVAQRRRFLLDATEGLAVEAVVEIVQAAATSSKQTISNSMVRLLSKLSAFAESGTEAVRAQADSALREQVRELIGDWSLQDPNPEGYTAALESMSHTARTVAPVTASQHEPEPFRLVKMALELGAVGPAFWQAAESVLEKELKALVEVLVEAAPDSVPAAALWERLATKENILRLLSEEPVDFETLNRMLDHMPVATVTSLLLETLAAADSRSTRLGLLDRLKRLGPPIQAAVLEGLNDPRWYVQRNMLALLGDIGCPPGFSVSTFLRHPEPALRREAIQLGMEIPADRERALCLAIADKDGRAFRLGVRGLARGDVPHAAVPLIANRLNDDSLPTDLRTPLVRGLKGVRSPLALEGLLRLAIAGKTLFGKPKLAPKSPELLVTLSILADTWPREPRVRALLARVRSSADPEIRAAADADHARND